MHPLLDVPDLGPRYDRALQSALAYLFDRFEPVAVVICGSIIRGTPDPASDLDIFAFHDAPWRQRVQRRFDGVPVELFVNHPDFIAGYFAEERNRGTPSTAHMLATGHLALDRDGLMAGYIEESRQMLVDGPEVDDGRLVLQRYQTAMLFEDALDVVDRDADLASMMLHSAVESALRYRFWIAGQWQPRNKDLLAAMATLDPELEDLARGYFSAATTRQRLELARAILRRTTGETGAFDWESPEDHLRESI